MHEVTCNLFSWTHPKKGYITHHQTNDAISMNPIKITHSHVMNRSYELWVLNFSETENIPDESLLLMLFLDTFIAH